MRSDYFCFFPHHNSDRWPKPRLNRANMFRKLSQQTLKRIAIVHYFGKPKSWSNNFYRRVTGYA